MVILFYSKFMNHSQKEDSTSALIDNIEKPSSFSVEPGDWDLLSKAQQSSPLPFFSALLPCS